MEFKNGYKLIEFDNQIEYAEHIYNLIINNNIKYIQYCGLTEDLNYIDIRERIKNYTNKKYEDWKSNLKPYVIIKRINTTSNKKEYKKEYLKRKKEKRDE